MSTVLPLKLILVLAFFIASFDRSMGMLVYNVRMKICSSPITAGSLTLYSEGKTLPDPNLKPLIEYDMLPTPVLWMTVHQYNSRPKFYLQQWTIRPNQGWLQSMI